MLLNIISVVYSVDMLKCTYSREHQGMWVSLLVKYEIAGAFTFFSKGESFSNLV